MVNMNAMKTFTLTLMLASGSAFAQATPMGLWKVVDDEMRSYLGPFFRNQHWLRVE